jgi:hypothetical protein
MSNRQIGCIIAGSLLGCILVALVGFLIGKV